MQIIISNTYEKQRLLYGGRCFFNNKNLIMKKTFLFLSAIAIIASLSSCSKTCHCTDHIVGSEFTMDYTLKELQEEYPNDNIQKCSDFDHTSENAGILIGMNCK